MVARKLAGGRLRRCRLALGEGLLSHRLLALPALGKRELREVLERKARNLAGEDEDNPIFSGQDVGPSADGGRNWLTVTLEREFVSSLLIRLRSHHLRIRKVVSTTLAGLSRAAEVDHGDGRAAIMVTVGHDAVEVSLISDTHLASSDTLEGDLRESPHLVTGLLQLVRTAAAFWRKSQRGAEVASVHVIGMPADRGVFLAQAIESALPGTEVYCDPSAEDETPGAGRIAVLNACLGGGPLALDLQIPLPPRRTLAMLGLGACAGSLLLGFGIVQRAVEEPRAQLLNEIATLESQTADLPLLQRRQQEMSESLGLVVRRIGRALEIDRHGPEYDSAMTMVLSSLGQRAALLTVSIAPGTEQGNALHFTAVTRSASLRALKDIREIEEVLGDLPQLSDIRVDLPTNLDGEEAGSGVTFTVTALLEIAR